MPRNYTRAIGKKPYANYTKDQFQKALLAAYSGKNLRFVQDKYGVPRSTLSRHMNNKNTGKYGRPPVFDKNEENVMAESISLAGDWGFPLSKYDIRCLVKAHLDRKGLKEPRFKNNFPGPDWIECFIKRHKDKLTERLSQNIKRSRAAVDGDAINEYFDQLEDSLKDVEPAMMVNYDETNLTDDPKRQKVVVRRSCRHPEKIMDNSKSSTSVMFSSAGNGDILPVYVNYKAENLYNTWTIGGPSGTVYNRTKSGWFTMEVFEDWFRTVILPYFKKFEKEKPKVLIGDNLASHVSIWVIKQCNKENIRFVLLPPNSTGLCQPLDVAFFKPLKTKWSKVLSEWKIKNRGVIPKDTFPRLLKRCLEEMSGKSSENVRAGFKGSGLIPLDRNQVLKRMPQEKGTTSANKGQEWVESFTDFLKEFRAKETQPMRQVKKKKLDIKPGASVTNVEKMEHDKTVNRGKHKIEKSESETDTDATISLQDSDYDIDFIGLDEESNNFDDDDSILKGLSKSSDPLAVEIDISEPSTSKVISPESIDHAHNVLPSTTSKESKRKKSLPTSVDQAHHVKLDPTKINTLSTGDFVVVKFLYDAQTKKPVEKRFVGQIIKAVQDSHVFVKVMRKSTKAENTFVFPNVDDEQLVHPENVISKIVPLQVSRGRHLFPKFIKEYCCS